MIATPKTQSKAIPQPDLLDQTEVTYESSETVMPDRSRCTDHAHKNDLPSTSNTALDTAANKGNPEIQKRDISLFTLNISYIL